MEKMRSMLSNSGLEKHFWAEAVRTACYLINRSPTTALDNGIPEEFWTGKKVNYSHLKIFGCEAFVHIPKEHRSKLDNKSMRCIFLGYADSEFGYRLWDPVNNKVIRSRDVIFNELEMYKRHTGNMEVKKIANRFVEQQENIPPLQEENYEQHAESGGQQAGNNGQQVDNGGQQEEGILQQPLQEVQVENIPPELVRRSNRPHKPSQRYPPSNYVLLTDDGEPSCFQEACDDEHSKDWKKAMQEEMDSLLENKTWELVKLPKERKSLQNKWVYRIKQDGEGKKERYKARLVVKGFAQKEGIDFNEIFSPVVKMSSIRVVLGLIAALNLECEQLDVKTAFLHGELEEEIYMEQPEGFQVKGKENLVCRLKKSLYGLKQAPRQWYKKFDAFMLKHGFSRLEADHCVYIKRYDQEKYIMLLLYVDDMLIVGHDKNMISKLKKDLGSQFAMKDLGPAQQILGMRIIRDRKKKRLWLSQEKYIEKVLNRFNMKDAKSVSTPLAAHFKLSADLCPCDDKEKEEMSKIPYASAVGSLMYAMVCTRPDIAHSVGVVSRFLANPGKKHWEAVKWILRYLKGTGHHCLCFGNNEIMLEGFADADMDGVVNTRKSTTGYVYTFVGVAVSWISKLQKVVALSTTEAEYIAATEACKEMLWMQRFLVELGIKQDKYVLHCDSQSAIHLAKNPAFHSKTKHIDLRYHWIRQVLEEGQLQLEKIHTDENLADMFTKILPKTKQELCRRLVGLGVT